MGSALLVALLLARDPDRLRAEGQDAPRLMAALGVGGFADAGQGFGRGGPAVALSMPLLFGQRRKVFQWGFAIDAESAWDPGARLAMIGAGPTALARLHLGRVYAIHLGFGAHATAQVGRIRALGVMPMFITIENAFRFFDDDRQRFVLGFRIGPGLWFRNAPGNDAPFGPAAFAYLGFETTI